MRLLSNFVKEFKTNFEQITEDFEDYEDQNSDLIMFLSMLMLLNDIFIKFQEIYDY